MGGLTKEEQLQKELDQAKAGTHSRMVAEEKRLAAQTTSKLRRAEQLRQFSLNTVETQFEAERRAATEVYEGHKSELQDRLAQEVLERQRRQTKMEAPELRAVTRKMRQMRGETAGAAAAKTVGKRDPKGAANAIPLRQGEVEEDFEAMAALASQLAPSLDIDLEMDVQPSKRLRPVETARPVRAEGPGGKRAARRSDFDFKGKPRAEVSGARITVWYEEEHGGRKMDVPYVGVVNSCDPREGLYVKFDSSPEEMLITNEDDWRWGSHQRKPPEGTSTGRAAGSR